MEKPTHHNFKTKQAICKHCGGEYMQKMDIQKYCLKHKNEYDRLKNKIRSAKHAKKDSAKQEQELKERLEKDLH